jgi:hypothetical protein
VVDQSEEEIRNEEEEGWEEEEEGKIVHCKVVVGLEVLTSIVVLDKQMVMRFNLASCVWLLFAACTCVRLTSVRYTSVSWYSGRRYPLRSPQST